MKRLSYGLAARCQEGIWIVIGRFCSPEFNTVVCIVKVQRKNETGFKDNLCAGIAKKLRHACLRALSKFRNPACAYEQRTRLSNDL